jgi:hypothetical protein
MPIPPNPGKPAHSSLRPTYFDTLKNFPTLGTGPLAAAPRETGPRPPVSNGEIGKIYLIKT